MNQSKPSVFITHTVSNFCTKKNLLRDWTVSNKINQHLVFKRSFYLCKSNNYQVFNHTKIRLRFLFSAGRQENR